MTKPYHCEWLGGEARGLVKPSHLRNNIYALRNVYEVVKVHKHILMLVKVRTNYVAMNMFECKKLVKVLTVDANMHESNPACPYINMVQICGCICYLFT